MSDGERTLEDFFREIFISWERIRRWHGKAGVTYENDLEHSWKTATQTAILLAMNGKQKDIDFFELLVCGILHDIGEAITGVDIPYTIKNDPRMKGALTRLEEKQFDLKFSELPTRARSVLVPIYHIQDHGEITAGKFFALVEYFGYATFAIEENAMNKSLMSRQIFTDVLNNSRRNLKSLIVDFPKLRRFVSQFIDFDGAEKLKFNPERVLRQIILSWKSRMAWPEFSTVENILERVMKNALLGCIMLSVEREARRDFDAFSVLSALLFRNLSKATYPVWPWRMKRDLDFPTDADHEIEQEHFSGIVDQFPKPTRQLLINCFDLKKNRKSKEGKMYAAIKFFGYGLFALYEFERGHKEYAEVLYNVQKLLSDCASDIQSLQMFYAPLEERFRAGVKYWQKQKK